MLIYSMILKLGRLFIFYKHSCNAILIRFCEYKILCIFTIKLDSKLLTQKIFVIIYEKKIQFPLKSIEYNMYSVIIFSKNWFT